MERDEKQYFDDEVEENYGRKNTNSQNAPKIKKMSPIAPQIKVRS